MTEPAENDAARLLTSATCGLLLVAPLTWTMGATSYVGVLLGTLACALVAAAHGLALRRALPGSLGISLVTVACVVPASLIALLVLGPATDRATTALSLGVPVAAVGAVLSTLTARGLRQDKGRDGVVTGAVLLGVSLALTAVALVPNAAERIADGRTAAHIEAALAGAGVLPLMPELDGLTASDEPRVGLESTGYWIDLVVDGAPESDASSVRVDVGPELDAEAAEQERSICDDERNTCTPHEDGYVVVEEYGQEINVVATVGRTRLEATLYRRDGDLPEPDEVGRALLDADLVDWDDLLRIVETAD